MLNGILRCKNQKGCRKWVGVATNCHLFFLHCLEQGGLGFSGSVSQMLDAYGQGKAEFAEQGE